MTLNQSLSISLNSMQNNQQALAVVSHNIANLNTKGYAKERINFAESRFHINSNSVIAKIHSLNGAEVSSLTNSVDEAKFRNMVETNSNAQYYNNLADALGELESVADDLGDNGLNALLNNFFKVSGNLEQFPSDLSTRQQYVMALDNVCDKFNYISDRYISIQDEHNQNILNATTNINTMIDELSNINMAHIKNGQSTSTQNDINAILSELSNYADITYDQNVNGSYNLYIGGIPVLRGTQPLYYIESSFDKDAQPPLTISLKSTEEKGSLDITDSIKTGSLKSEIDFMNSTSSKVGFSTLGDMQKAIKSAQEAFATALNGIQQHVDANENTYAAYITSESGELILAADPSDPTKPALPPELLVFDAEGRIQVNQEVAQDPFKIAAARIDLDDYAQGEDWTKSIGNADNARFMTALQNEKICSFGSGTNNCTLSQFLINNAAKNGMDLAAMENKAELYQGIADQSANEYEDMIGVNLDEELADMIKYQRAYEASARIFSVVNDITQLLMNLV